MDWCVVYKWWWIGVLPTGVGELCGSTGVGGLVCFPQVLADLYGVHRCWQTCVVSTGVGGLVCFPQVLADWCVALTRSQ